MKTKTYLNMNLQYPPGFMYTAKRLLFLYSLFFSLSVSFHSCFSITPQTKQKQFNTYCGRIYASKKQNVHRGRCSTHIQVHCYIYRWPSFKTIQSIQKYIRTIHKQSREKKYFYFFVKRRFDDGDDAHTKTPTKHKFIKINK